MINDLPRSSQYERAISGAVARLSARPDVRERGGVVALDIGTGTGLLALMCARLPGVRLVHACEMNDALCAVAREVIASRARALAGVEDQHFCDVKVHCTVSTDLELQERVDLVFCEVFDAGLLGELALPTILDARR